MKTTHTSQFKKFMSKVSKLPSSQTILIEGFGKIHAYRSKNGRRFAVSRDSKGECAMTPAGNYKVATVLKMLDVVG